MSVASNNTKTIIFGNFQHYTSAFNVILSQSILVEEEIDIEAAWSSIFLRLDLVMMFSVMKLVYTDGIIVKT